MNARLLSRPGLSCSGILCSFASALMPHAMEVTTTWMPLASYITSFRVCIDRQTCQQIDTMLVQGSVIILFALAFPGTHPYS